MIIPIIIQYCGHCIRSHYNSKDIQRVQITPINGNHRHRPSLSVIISFGIDSIKPISHPLQRNKVATNWHLIKWAKNWSLGPFGEHDQQHITNTHHKLVLSPSTSTYIEHYHHSSCHKISLHLCMNLWYI